MQHYLMIYCIGRIVEHTILAYELKVPLEGRQALVGAHFNLELHAGKIHRLLSNE